MHMEERQSRVIQDITTLSPALPPLILGSHHPSTRIDRRTETTIAVVAQSRRGSPRSRLPSLWRPFRYASVQDWLPAFRLFGCPHPNIQLPNGSRRLTHLLKIYSSGDPSLLPPPLPPADWTIAFRPSLVLSHQNEKKKNKSLEKFIAATQ